MIPRASADGGLLTQKFPIQNMDIILLVAGLIIVIKGINLGFKILHRLVDKRLPGCAAHTAEVRG